MGIGSIKIRSSAASECSSVDLACDIVALILALPRLIAVDFRICSRMHILQAIYFKMFSGIVASSYVVVDVSVLSVFR